MNKEQIEFLQKDCSDAASWSVPLLNELRNQKLMVAGGTGFIGSWIAELISLLNDSYNFNTSLILLSRNTEPFQEEKKHLSKRKDIQFIEKDIRNINELPKDITYLIHAASSPDNRVHMSNPIETISAITKGTDNLLDSAFKLQNLKKILYLSSGQVYGKNGIQKARISEADFGSLDCNKITSVYPEAKRLAEATCCAYSSQFKLPVVIARPFSFIGPCQSLSKPWAINNFINDALHGKTIRIIGNGEPVRSYMYPADMVAWLLRILVAGKNGSGYNVGSPVGISLKNIAEKIVQATKSKVDIEIKFYNTDSSIFIPDIALCEKELGLNLNYTIEDTIRRSIAWFKLL